VWDDMVRADAVSADVLADPAEVANRKAELMTAAADVSLEGAKSVNRFMLLVNELRDASYQDPARRAQVESLIDYSKKSIFSERGGAALLREWAASDVAPINLLSEVERFVTGEMAAARSREDDVRTVRDQLVEAHVRIRYLEGELARLRAAEMSSEQKIDQLQGRLQAALDEKRKIVELRGRLAS